MTRNKRRKKKKDFFANYDYSKFAEVSPVCPHFGECGGCSFQHISYDDQIQLKKEYLKDLFSKDVDVVSATDSLGYRNRMDFVYNKGILGLRKKGDFKAVIDITDCSLIPKQFRPLFQEVKSELFSRSISSYDIEEQSGFLRYVVFRFAPTTGEVMLIFTSSTPKDEQEKESFENLLNYFASKVTSVHWCINDSLTDISIPYVDSFKVFGKETITEKIGDISLSFGPLSFFQANSVMSELVFEEIKKEVSGEIVDLCCGVGAISLFVADNAVSISGIEEIQQAIVLAKENALANGIKNALFFADDMKNLEDYAPLHVDTLILDPPRAGLGSKVVKKVLSLDAEKIVYMSCNPKTQKIDIDALTKDGLYELTSLKGFDMFGQTPHVETLAILARKDS